MRTTLRLSLVGTAILALAAGTAGIAVAQDEADDDAVPAAARLPRDGWGETGRSRRSPWRFPGQWNRPGRKVARR